MNKVWRLLISSSVMHEALAQRSLNGAGFCFLNSFVASSRSNPSPLSVQTYARAVSAASARRTHYSDIQLQKF